MHLKSTKTPSARLSREERRAQTVSALREAALQQFATLGVGGTSAERIAEAAGFTRGAFYANYENKQALLLELISERMASEQASWLELAQSTLDLETLLDVLNERALHFDAGGLWSMIAAETYLYALRDPVFAQAYGAFHAQTRSTFTQIIDRLMQRAGKTSPIALDVLCDAFLALNRTMRLPVPGDAHSTPQPMPHLLLITLLRGLIAIAPPRDGPAPPPPRTRPERRR
jgi:AcrR family transcriptional regulator